MAGAGYKLFNTGDVLTAAQVNTYLQEQVVMVFANAAARTTALSGVLAEGMVSYLKDTDALEIYSGSAWVGYGSGDITGITTGATSGLIGGVTSGTADLKLNTTAKGGLLVGTGSGTSSELTVGANNTVLTADSSTATGLKWAAASSGLTKISTTSFTTQATQAFDNVFSSSYTAYVIVFEELFTSTANNAMRFQWRYAGPTTQSTAYYNGFTGGSTTGSNFAGGGVSNGAHLQISTNVGNSSDQAMRGYVNVYGCSGASKVPHATYQTSNGYDGTTANGGGWVNQPRIYTGFILSAAAGNITGTVTIYGMAA